MGTYTAAESWTGSRRGRAALAVAVTAAGAGALAASLAGTANATPVVHHDGPPVADTHHGGALTAAEHHGHHSHRDRATRSCGCSSPQTATVSRAPDTAGTSILDDLLGAPRISALPTPALLPLLGGSGAAVTPQPAPPTPQTPPTPTGPPPATRARPANTAPSAAAPTTTPIRGSSSAPSGPTTTPIRG